VARVDFRLLEALRELSGLQPDPEEFRDPLQLAAAVGRRTAGVSVRTLSGSSTVRVQAGTGPPRPSTSTKHSLHDAAAGFTFSM
jgi:hypothetical protein